MTASKVYRIDMNVHVRARNLSELPEQREVENVIADMLLALPRLDDEDQKTVTVFSRPLNWDVASTSIPGGLKEH